MSGLPPKTTMLRCSPNTWRLLIHTIIYTSLQALLGWYIVVFQMGFRDVSIYYCILSVVVKRFWIVYVKKIIYGYHFSGIKHWKKSHGEIYRGIDLRFTICTVFCCTFTLINNAVSGVTLQFTKVVYLCVAVTQKKRCTYGYLWIY